MRYLPQPKSPIQTDNSLPPDSSMTPSYNDKSRWFWWDYILGYAAMLPKANFDFTGARDPPISIWSTIVPSMTIIHQPITLPLGGSRLYCRNDDALLQWSHGTWDYKYTRRQKGQGKHWCSCDHLNRKNGRFWQSPIGLVIVSFYH